MLTKDSLKSKLTAVYDSLAAKESLTNEDLADKIATAVVESIEEELTIMRNAYNIHVHISAAPGSPTGPPISPSDSTLT